MKTLVKAIEKRSDVTPGEGISRHGDVTFADERNKKYPLDTEAHVRNALSRWGDASNRAKYSAEDQKTIGGKIRAAAKKLGIGASDDGEDKTESSLVYGAAILDLGGQTPEEIVYLPKGESTIWPQRPGKEITVKVDARAAELLQADLEKRFAGSPRPYGAFDHQRGSASFLPKEFRWDDERGVILQVDWTEPGEKAVKGRGHSYFSPTFMRARDGTIAGLPRKGEVGSLVNDPAFEDPKMKIAAAAKDDGEDGDDGNGMQECPKCGHKFKAKTEASMDEIAEKLVELEVITAAQADDPETVVKAVVGMHEALSLTQAANARLQSENTALAAKVADVQKAEAMTVVESAIAEGKIPSKDQGAIDFWLAQLTSNFVGAKKILASLQVNPLLQRVIDVKASDTKRVASGQSDADLVQAQHLAIDEVCAKNPGMTRAKAFDIAKREKPHVFPVEA